MEYASKGVANSGLGLGIAGTALGLLNNGGIGNILGGGWNGGCSDNMPVTRYELSMSQQLSAKDGEIALLKADKYTDQKLTEVYEALNNKITALKDEQYGINLNQAVLNGTTNATISCIQGQIAALQSLTKVIVPNASVYPGWGDVTVSIPTTSA